MERCALVQGSILVAAVPGQVRGEEAAAPGKSD
jgi:hypothetical protein